MKQRGSKTYSVRSQSSPGPTSPTTASIRFGTGIVVLALSVAGAFAEGFRNPPPGAFNLGRAGGRIAQVDDSSAVAQNPANLVDSTNVDVQFTPSIVYLKVDYRSPGGQSATTTAPWKVLPNLFASVPLFDNRLAFGLGVTTPYGLANKWDKHSDAFSDPMSLRYQAPYYTRLMTINAAPSVSVKAGDYLSLGAGLDVMWSQLKMKQLYPWFLVAGPGTPDGNVRARVDGVGVGANFGLTLHLTPRQRIAVTVRTPVRVDYDGSLVADNVPAVMGGGSVRGTLQTRITFPTIVAAGYAIELNHGIRLETDFEWLEFSRFDNLPLKGTTAASLGLPPSIPQNWKDTFTVGIAGDWRFAENWTVRAGYQFYESPVPDETFSPTIPDANQNVITLGLNYHCRRHSLEAAYGYDFYGDRNIRNNQNPAFDGKYRITVHLFSLTYRYSF